MEQVKKNQPRASYDKLLNDEINKILANLGPEQSFAEVARQAVSNLEIEYGHDVIVDLREANSLKAAEKAVRRIQETAFTAAQGKAVKNGDLFDNGMNEAPIKTAGGGVIKFKHGTWADNEPHYNKVKDQAKAINKTFAYLDDKREVHRPYQENNPAVTNEQVQWMVENGKVLGEEE